jgi:hypothetical protein
LDIFLCKRAFCLQPEQQQHQRPGRVELTYQMRTYRCI